MNLEPLIQTEGVNPLRMTEITSRVFEELSSSPNKFGHLVIIRTGVDQLNNVLELSQRYVSSD